MSVIEEDGSGTDSLRATDTRRQENRWISIEIGGNRKSLVIRMLRRNYAASPYMCVIAAGGRCLIRGGKDDQALVHHTCRGSL
jgi:hypothetical protein